VQLHIFYCRVLLTFRLQL